MASKELKLKVTQEGISKTTGDFGQLKNSIAGTVKKMVGLGAAIVVAKKAFDGLSGAIKQAIAQQEIFNRLRNAVNLTGESYAELKDSIDLTFQSLQRTTRYGDTDAARVLQQLIILTGDYQKSMKALPIVLNMAASGLFDVSAATRYVGMAMTGNIEMLGRYISEFKVANNEMLKHMSASEKAAYAIDTLTKKFGNLAEADLDTTAGKIQQMKNYLGDFAESIGDVFTPAVDLFADGMIKILQSITEVEIKHKVFVDNWISAEKRWAEFQKNNQDKINNEVYALMLDAIGKENIALLEGYDDKKKLIEQYYNVVKQADKTYQTYLENKIEFELELLKTAGLNEIELEKYKQAKLKEIREQFAPPEIIKPEIDIADFSEDWNDFIESVNTELDEDEIIVSPEIDLTGFNNMKAEMKRAKLWASQTSDFFYEAFGGNFDNIEKSFVNMLKRMAADFMSSLVFRMLFSGATGGIGMFAKGGLFGGIFHEGGTIINAGGQPVKASTGLDMIVPQGYPNDSFPIMVESGERVTVTSANQTSNDFKEIITELRILRQVVAEKPVANTIMFSDIDMAKYVEQGNIKRIGI